MANGLYRVVPHVGPGSTVEGQVLGQDFVHGIEMVIAERSTERQDTCMPLVTPQEQGHPIERIGKETPHSY